MIKSIPELFITIPVAHLAIRIPNSTKIRTITTGIELTIGELQIIRILSLLELSDFEEQNSISSTFPENGRFWITADLEGVVPILSYMMNARTLRENSAKVLSGQEARTAGAARLPGVEV